MLRHHVYCVHTSLELAEVIDHFSYFFDSILYIQIKKICNLSQTRYAHTKEALEHDHDATECFLHLH